MPGRAPPSPSYTSPPSPFRDASYLRDTQYNSDRATNSGYLRYQHCAVMAPSNGERTAGKAKLTLEKLASYDDVITDALVDKVGQVHIS